MRIVTDRAQEEYWKRVGYNASDHPVAVAYAVPKVEHIKRFVEFPQGKVLDVACGTGVFTALLQELSHFVVGIDHSDYMLRRNPGRQLLRGRAEQLPFRSAAFNLVFIANLLHHSAEPERVVQEAARVTRRYVVLIEPNRLNPLMFALSLLVREERGGLRSSRGYLIGLLERSGLEVVRCSAMGMISQNRTPARLIPLLRRFDREIAWGEYLVAIARKP